MLQISPEARLIILCVREPDASDPGAVRQAAERVLNWRAVYRLAVGQRVVAYVRRAIDGGVLSAPADFSTAVRNAELVGVAHVMRLDAELFRLMGAFRQDSQPVIVLKGPALARSIYPTRELRPYGDLDLVVHETDGVRTGAMLQAYGFAETAYAAEDARRARAGYVSRNTALHRIFTSHDGQVKVELHLDPLQLGLKPTSEAERWQRALPIPGIDHALMLAPEDQLIHLSVHAHKHGFDRLIWLKDIDLLIRTHGRTLNWQRVLEVARSEGVRSSVWYTMRLTALTLGTEVPAHAVSRLAPSAIMQRLYRRIWSPSTIAGMNGFMRRRAVQFHAAESWRGMLPSLLLMERRRSRARAILQYLIHR